MDVQTAVDNLEKGLDEATTGLKQMFIGLMIFSFVTTIAVVVLIIKTSK